MTVYIVTLQIDNGMIVGVFSSLERASTYIAKHSYNAYTITERVVDEPVSS